MRNKGVEAQLIVKIPPWLMAYMRRLHAASANQFWRPIDFDFGVGVFSFIRPLIHLFTTHGYKKPLSDHPGRFVCEERSSSGGSAGRFLLDNFDL